MREESIVRMIDDLPDSATHEEAIAWVKRMRRIVDRWESLPGYTQYALTPEDKLAAHAELDDVEHAARFELALRALGSPQAG